MLRNPVNMVYSLQSVAVRNLNTGRNVETISVTGL